MKGYKMKSTLQDLIKVNDDQHLVCNEDERNKAFKRLAGYLEKHPDYVGNKPKFKLVCSCGSVDDCQDLLQQYWFSDHNFEMKPNGQIVDMQTGKVKPLMWKIAKNGRIQFGYYE